MSNQKVFEASPESKGKAKQLRLFAFLAWIVAIAAEVFAILKLISDDMMVWLIVTIVGILALSILGRRIWAKFTSLVVIFIKRAIYCSFAVGPMKKRLSFCP